MATKIIYFKNKNDGLFYVAVVKTNLIGKVHDFKMCRHEHVFENGEYRYDARMSVPLEIIGYSNWSKIAWTMRRIFSQWQKLKLLLQNRLPKER